MGFDGTLPHSDVLFMNHADRRPARPAHDPGRGVITLPNPQSLTTSIRATAQVFEDPQSVALLARIRQIAPSEANVLIIGETGTGKELVARQVHLSSLRASKPFLAINCGAFSETLFESELFGHERGAFTGAVSRKIGLVEAAAGGTLFLDEVGDIPLSIQVKLLRLLETGTFRRVGSTELRQADIRVISATHRPLADMVAGGQFRQDLYYRLNIFPIFLPPLRERGEDIELLAEALLTRVGGNRMRRFSPSAREWLQHYEFPGNVRELRNLLERACLLCDGEEIEVRHLTLNNPSRIVAPKPSAMVPRQDLGNPLSDDALRTLAQGFSGSRKALARHLGLSERTLYRRLKALGH